MLRGIFHDTARNSMKEKRVKTKGLPDNFLGPKLICPRPLPGAANFAN